MDVVLQQTSTYKRNEKNRPNYITAFIFLAKSNLIFMYATASLNSLKDYEREQ